MITVISKTTLITGALGRNPDKGQLSF